jgi:hypothetical protein
MTMDMDLIKAARTSHKYIKRTGVPGAYKYWYKTSDGRLVSGADAERELGVKHEDGQKDHARRLLIARADGLHSMSKKQIGRQVGIDHTKGVFGWNTEDLKRGGHEKHHLKEAIHHDVDHALYHDHIAAHHGDRYRGHTAPAPAARPHIDTSPSGEEVAARTATARRAAIAEAEAADRQSGTSEEHLAAAVRRVSSPATPAPARTEADALEEMRRLSPKLHAALTESSETPEAVRAAAAALAPHPTPASEADRRRRAEEDRLAAGHTMDAALQRTPAPSAPAHIAPALSAREARTRSEQAAQDAAEEANFQRTRAMVAARSELSAQEPAFAASEAETHRMETEHANGGNPYLAKAEKIFNRIKGELKAERKQICEHMLEAISAAGPNPTDAVLLAKYNEIAGTRKRALHGKSSIGEEFEKGSFTTLHEIMNNPPVNAEVERMKRGYTMKQIARLKPYFSERFMSANPDGFPPPMPTFGDLGNWAEYKRKTGHDQPGYAAAERSNALALPQDVFDALPKGPDGKIKKPPMNTPVHLMPAWIYSYNRSTAVGERTDPYANPGTVHRDAFSAEGTPNVGTQAKFQEGIWTATLRKYVQMHGQDLVEIPDHKLSKLNLTQADIFKGELSDSQVNEIARTKYIDPVRLVAFMKTEEKKQDKAKKSFSLIVKSDEVYTPGETLAKADLVVESKVENVVKSGMVIDIRKSRIEKIERILLARRNR